MASIAAAPSPTNSAQRNPRCAPSLRMVRLIGPTGMDAKTRAHTNPASAASNNGCASGMSVDRLPVFLVLNFPPPRARQPRPHESIDEVTREKDWQHVVQNL